MNNHPEQKHGETFIGNKSTLEKRSNVFDGLTSYRLGVIAYDINGQAMIDPCDQDLRPVFLNGQDLRIYNLRMEARLSAIRNGKRSEG